MTEFDQQDAVRHKTLDKYLNDPNIDLNNPNVRALLGILGLTDAAGNPIPKAFDLMQQVRGKPKNPPPADSTEDKIPTYLEPKPGMVDVSIGARLYGKDPNDQTSKQGELYEGMRRRIINDWFGGRLRLPPELIDTPDYDPKPGPDEKMLAGQNQMPASMVRKFPPWMRDIIRSTPDYPKAEKPGTHQFDPRDVPIIPIDPAGNRAFDPMFGRGDETLMAGGDQRSLMLNYLNSLMGMPGGAGDDQTKMLRPIMGLIQALAGGQT